MTPLRKPFRTLVPVLVLGVVVTGLGFAYVWQGNRLQQLTAANEDTARHVEAAQAINRTLAMRIEEAFSLERLARIARDQLGMSEPTPDDIRYVQPPPIPTD